MKANAEANKCTDLVLTSVRHGVGVSDILDKQKKCYDALPPPETFLAKDLRKGESFDTYSERKDDEWAERDCRWQGFVRARFIEEMSRIEEQCKRDLEIVRLRKAVEKLNAGQKSK